VGEQPGPGKAGQGRVRTAVSTSTLGNSTAFGFSITITGSFGVLQTRVGSPSVLQIVMFAVAAALALGLVQAAVTRGFRDRTGSAPTEVALLGTAQDFLSVALALLAVAGTTALVRGSVAWLLGGAVAALVFLGAEALETLVAEVVQKRRGDPDAEQERA
jgi:hypothetical protein